jgi:hypothetical protein
MRQKSEEVEEKVVRYLKSKSLEILNIQIFKQKVTKETKGPER